MEEADWDKYMIKRPLPTYKEKIDSVEAMLDAWAGNRCYRQPGVRLNDVATALGVAAAHISYCVNTRKQLNFAAWVNSLRIADAKQLIEQHPEMLPNELSRMVGYPTPAAFKAKFLQFAACTVEEWRAQCKK